MASRSDVNLDCSASFSYPFFSPPSSRSFSTRPPELYQFIFPHPFFFHRRPLHSPFQPSFAVPACFPLLSAARVHESFTDSCLELHVASDTPPNQSIPHHPLLDLIPDSRLIYRPYQFRHLFTYVKPRYRTSVLSLRLQPSSFALAAESSIPS